MQSRRLRALPWTSSANLSSPPATACGTTTGKARVHASLRPCADGGTGREHGAWQTNEAWPHECPMLIEGDLIRGACHTFPPPRVQPRELGVERHAATDAAIERGLPGGAHARLAYARVCVLACLLVSCNGVCCMATPPPAGQKRTLAAAAGGVLRCARCRPSCPHISCWPPPPLVYQVAEWLLEQALVHQRRTLHEGTPGEWAAALGRGGRQPAERGGRWRAASASPLPRTPSAPHTQLPFHPCPPGPLLPPVCHQVTT